MAEAPDGCPIKGNIARGGERIYHTPWYERIQISAAQAAGWRAAEE